MTAVLLSVHVLAGIIFVGPVTVAVSLFPRYARLATADGSPGAPTPVVELLHRISTVYAVLGLSVPVFGLAVAQQLEVLTDGWVLVAAGLTVAAAVLLAVVILPGQRRVVAALAEPSPRPGQVEALGRLGGASGLFALLWAVVVVLMIVRPGSTTEV